MKNNSLSKSLTRYAAIQALYKLLFSVSSSKKKYLKDNIKNIKKIGFFSSGKGVEIYDHNKKKIKFKKKGFCHF